MESNKLPIDFKYLIDLLSDDYDTECDNESDTSKETDMKKDCDYTDKMSFAGILDTLEVPDTPYNFPYEDYEIVGDTAEIERVINTCGFVNLDVADIVSTLSKEWGNYVTVGSAEGEGCIANALKDAIGKLPIEIKNTSNILFNIWMPMNLQSPMTEMKSMIDIINPLPSDINICWGCALDELLEGQQAKVTLIAASK